MAGMSRDLLVHACRSTGKYIQDGETWLGFREFRAWLFRAWGRGFEAEYYVKLLNPRCNV